LKNKFFIPTLKQTRLRKAKAMRDWRSYSKKRKSAGIKPIGIKQYVEQELNIWSSSGGRK